VKRKSTPLATTGLVKPSGVAVAIGVLVGAGVGVATGVDVFVGGTGVLVGAGVLVANEMLTFPRLQATRVVIKTTYTSTRETLLGFIEALFPLEDSSDLKCQRALVIS
jgi:hypothetical protein